MSTTAGDVPPSNHNSCPHCQCPYCNGTGVRPRDLNPLPATYPWRWPWQPYPNYYFYPFYPYYHPSLTWAVTGAANAPAASYTIGTVMAGGISDPH